MNAVYESGLALVRDKSKQKSTFSEFVKSTLDQTPNSIHGEIIDVSLDQPAINQLWVCVNQIIKQVNMQMKSFMIQFGVTSDSISPFCKKFENTRSLLDEVKKYMGKTGMKNRKVTKDDKLMIPEIEDNDVSPTLGRIQNLISKVQETEEHIDEISASKENLVTEEDKTFFTYGNPSNTLQIFKDLARCDDMENISELCIQSMSALEI